MKLRSATLSSLIFVSSLSSAQQTGAPAVKGDQLVSYDSTRQWHYPYEVSSERRQQFVDALKGFQASSPLRDLTQQLGCPDRVEDLSKTTQPLSPFEQGFVDGHRDRLAYRFVWFARKLSKSPGISDSFLVAYVGGEGTQIVALHGNWLK